MPNSSIDPKLAKFVKYLEGEYLKFSIKTGRIGTQQDFARYLGVSQSALSHYMTGYRLPDRRTVGRMSMVLGQEIWEVVGMQPDEENDPRLLYIVDRWVNGMDNREREALLKYVKSRKGAKDTT